MRGDREPIEADTSLVARKVGIAAAVIVDTEGKIIYHVVSTMWSKLIIIALVAMMGACTLTSFMVLYNASRIDKQGLEIKKVKKEILPDDKPE